MRSASHAVMLPTIPATGAMLPPAPVRPLTVDMEALA
jgi:hypothetical protein